MFVTVASNDGSFLIRPIPKVFFFDPVPFGAGAMLILTNFPLNSSNLTAEHIRGVTILASQAQAAWGSRSLGGLSVGEFLGITDRSGGDKSNERLSLKRAKTARDALWAAMGKSDVDLSFSHGLGEQFAARYYGQKDGTRSAGFRGVVCYLWESSTTARDVGLKLAIKAAAPPEGGFGLSRQFLPPLHLGRKVPNSPFA